MVGISVYIYGIKIIKKFRWESGFLKGGSMEPLCTNDSAGYLMQLRYFGHQKTVRLFLTKFSYMVL